MVSILQSNQPIAWAIVPVTGFVWLLLSFWSTDYALNYLVIQATGSLVIAGMAHRIYVSYGFVERGDPALAWLSMTLLLLLLPLESIGSAIRSWAALFLLLAATDQILQVHRQASTSALQFRSGALAAFSVFLEPLHFGFVLGMFVVLAISRPFILREWLMLLLGLCWIFAIGTSAITYFPDLIPYLFPIEAVPIEQELGNRYFLPQTSRIWILVLSAWGVALMFREKTKISLRAQTTRWHLLVLFCASLLLAYLIDPKVLPFALEEVALPFKTESFGILDKLLAIGVAFGLVGLIPLTNRNYGTTDKSEAFRLFVVLVSLLILFLPSF